MLRFIGLGLSIDNIPIGNLKKLFECQKIFIDSYTSIWFPNIDLLVDILVKSGKSVVVARRDDLEGSAIRRILSESRDYDICIATPGDPFIATTHSAILSEALRMGIAVEISPSSSIVNVGISMSCLQIYRFGKIVTVVRPKNGIVYEYPFDVLKLNRELNLHTLMLLEIDVENNYYMNPREAIEILLEIQRMRGEEILGKDDKIIVLEALMSSSGRIYIESVESILRRSPDEYRFYPYTIIIPARVLHPIERECLENIDRVLYIHSINEKELLNIASYIFR
ncbi:Diphthine synthase [Ignisphaera aggregans DSM 17230]|uniref:Diphthine synthase n=1 Tax=Ignisphaera aggregans (strain DSM 17230 / JCM 13409 / AQ1.S1) TaxID=583356 RepID=E0SPF8_IGNAA|nr:Diphthine synthase [Ignisphaera aggregans DSM 17230]